MKHIAILASGEGSNALKLINFFRESEIAKVILVISDKATAPVIEKTLLSNVPVMILCNKNEFSNQGLVNFLKKQKTDLIVLAGFLTLLPESFIKSFPKKIINIHPALLPKHGGKGMYGKKVHETVISAKEKESGISIHYVNEKFDEGEMIAQFKCAVDENETAETLSKKIHALEYKHYPEVIEKLLASPT